MAPSAMLRELRSEAKALVALWGTTVAASWTVNENAGTIRDIWTGTLYCYLSPEWLDLDADDRAALT